MKIKKNAVFEDPKDGALSENIFTSLAMNQFLNLLSS